MCDPVELFRLAPTRRQVTWAAVANLVIVVGFILLRVPANPVQGDDVAVWRGDGLPLRATLFLALDYAFLTFYTFILVAFCHFVRAEQSPGSHYRRLGTVAGWIALAGGASDALENLCLLLLLHRGPNGSLAAIASAMGWLKWGCTALALLYAAGAHHWSDRTRNA